MTDRRWQELRDPRREAHARRGPVHEAGRLPGLRELQMARGQHVQRPPGRALEQARDSLEGLGVPLVGTNPLDLLDDLIDQSAAIVAYLREQVAALPTVLSGRRRPSARAALRTGARPSGPRGP